VILIVGGLPFFPALALGPIVEHFAMLAPARPSEEAIMSKRINRSPAIFDPAILKPPLLAPSIKLDPRQLVKQPGDLRHRRWWRWPSPCSSCATLRPGSAGAGFSGQIALWLWFTVLFANFAEAVAEGRGKAQADTCCARSETRPSARGIGRDAV
jgi:K+-transporting ATPase ATPase B chain